MIAVAFANLAVGLILAWAARERVRAEGPFVSPAFPMVLVHLGGFVIPVTLYFYFAHGDWAWLYLLDSARIPLLALLPLAIVHALLVFGGWYAGAALVRADRVRALLWTALAVTGVFALAVLAAWRRLLTATTYAGWRRGDTFGLMRVELGWALLVAVAASVGVLVYLLLELRQDGRRVRSNERARA